MKAKTFLKRFLTIARITDIQRAHKISVCHNYVYNYDAIIMYIIMLYVCHNQKRLSLIKT